jgi:amphi-Trp domain-containing protein
MEYHKQNHQLFKEAIMSEKSERDIEKVYSIEDFAAKLRRLADALEAGKPFEIQVAGERLYIPADAMISIEHERAKGEEELEFQLKWKYEALEEETKEEDEDDEGEEAEEIDSEES